MQIRYFFLRVVLQNGDICATIRLLTAQPMNGGIPNMVILLIVEIYVNTANVRYYSSPEIQEREGFHYKTNIEHNLAF